MMLAFGGVTVKESSYTMGAAADWFGKDKPRLVASNPLMNLPWFKDGDKVTTQSNAVLLQVAARCRLGGRGPSIP
ncbi:unnamed protein product [Polarella glacialis]|uniref:GST N-terminal domain-containing protein n=1 Tax=Polarella glacialis TaxID=89957 RepID=A0A813L387_POLGL|nr:unnamed protein product [Polarella glacialis]